MAEMEQIHLCETGTPFYFANMISFVKLQFEPQVSFWNSRFTLYYIFHWGPQTPFSNKIFIPNLITVSEKLTGNKHD